MGLLDQVPGGLLGQVETDEERRRREEKERRNPSWFEAYIEAPVRELGAAFTNLPNTAVDIANFVNKSPLFPPQIGRSIADAVLPEAMTARRNERDKEDLDWIREKLKPVEDFSEGLRADFPPENIPQELARMVGRAAPNLAIAIGTGGPGALLYGGARAGGASQREAEDRGLGELESSLKAALSAVGGGVLERLGAAPVRALLKRVPPTQRRDLLKRTLAATFGEGWTEGLQETLEVGLEAGTGADVGGAGDVAKRIGMAGAAGGLIGSVPAFTHARSPLSTDRGERLLTAKGGTDLPLNLPEQQTVHGLIEQRRAGESADFMEGRFVRERHLQEKNAWLKQNPGTKWADLDDAIDAYARRGGQVAIPPELKPTVDKGRELVIKHTDRLLAEDAESSFLNENQRDVFEQNRGEYLRISHRLHNDPRGMMREVAPHLDQSWFQSLTNPDPQPTPEWEAARDLIRNERPKENLNDQQVDGIIADLYRGNADAVVVAGATARAVTSGQVVERSPLMRRKEIPQEIRDIMGLEKRFESQLAESLRYTSAAYHSAKFYADLVQGGMGDLFTKTRQKWSDVSLQQIAAGKGRKATLAQEILTGQRLADGSQPNVFSPPSNKIPVTDAQGEVVTRGDRPVLEEIGKRWQTRPDLFVEPNLLTAIDQQLNNNPWMGVNDESGMMLKITRNAMRVIGGSKIGLTVLSVPAQFRNLQSNLFAIVAGGHDPVGRAYRKATGYKPAFDIDVDPFRDAAVQQQLLKPKDDAQAQRVLEQERLGVGTRGIEAGELDYFTGQAVSPGKGAAKLFTTPLRFLGNTWAWGDSSFRKMAYKLELGNLEAAYHGSLKAGNVAPEQVKREAAERAAQTIQNYERLPVLVQWMKANPLSAPFASFPTAVAINAKNQLKTAFQELGVVEPDVGSLASTVAPDRTISATQGAQRLAGLTAATAGAGALARTLINAVMGGDRPEPDEQHKKDMITGSPFWAKSSDLILVGSEPGVDFYYDLSYSSYFDVLARPIRASVRAGQIDESGFDEAMKEILEPFVAPEILTGKVFEAFANRNQYDRPIYDETDPKLEQIKDAAEHVTLAVAGPVKQAQRIVRSFNGEEDPVSERDIVKAWPEVMGLTGIRITALDYQKKFRNVLWDASNGIEKLDRSVGSVLQKGDPSTSEQINHALEFKQEGTLTLYRKMREMYEVGKRRGVPQSVLDSLLEQQAGLRRVEKDMVRGLLPPEQAVQIWMDTKIPNANDTRAKRRDQALDLWIKSAQANGTFTAEEERKARERIAKRWPIIQPPPG